MLMGIPPVAKPTKLIGILHVAKPRTMDIGFTPAVYIDQIN
jgi:hypothetical protein